MRKIAILLAASAALLLAGAFAFTADAITGGTALGLELLADRHGRLPRVGSRLRVRPDLGLPAAQGLLVRPLLEAMA